MDDLAFERVHRIQIHRLAGLAHVVDRVERHVAQDLAAALQKAVHVHDQVRTFAGLLLHGQAAQLLERVDHFAIAADQVLDVGVIVGHDLHHRAVVAHPHLDVAFVIGHVEQTLEVVGGDVRLFIELFDCLLVVLHHNCSFVHSPGMGPSGAPGAMCAGARTYTGRSQV